MSEMIESASAKTKIGGIDANIAALICYVPVSPINLIAQAVFFFGEPKENKFVRFHALQALIFGVSAFVTLMVLEVFGGILIGVGGAIDSSGLIAGLGSLFLMLVVFGVLGVALVVDVFCLYKAYSRAMFRIPVIGQLADRITG